MLYREIIAVCSKMHSKHINTLCGQNGELLNVKHGGKYTNHCVFKAVKKRDTDTRHHFVLESVPLLR